MPTRKPNNTLIHRTKCPQNYVMQKLIRQNIRIRAAVRLTALLTCLALMFALPPLPVGAYSYRVLSLGDSIAGGYGLSSPGTQRYSALVAEAWNAELTSKTVNGMTAGDLLLAIRSGAYNNQLQNADFVLINIGLNEIYLILRDLFAAHGSDAAGLAAALADNREMTRAAGELAGRMRTLSTLLYIKAPGAVICFNSIFNPYKGVVVKDADGNILLDLGAAVQPYIDMLNGAFLSDSKYITVDMAGVFAPDMLPAAYDPATGRFNTDVHPTAAGHRAMADAIVAAIMLEMPSDIDGHWGEMYIKRLLKYGLFENMLTYDFRPDTAMTRGEFVTCLGRLVGITTAKYSLYEVFLDVKKSDYCNPYVTWAFWNEIVLGTGGGRFSPNDPINREEMAVILERIIKLFALENNKLETYGGSFNDAVEISDWAQSSVKQISRLGIMVGDEGSNFNPLAGITRAEVATILYRMNQFFSLHNIIR